MLYKIIVFSVILVSTFLHSSNAGRFSAVAEWMKINPTARGSAVGLAFYPIAKGAGSLFYNPAYQGFLEAREINANHGIMVSGMSYDVLSYLEPEAGPGSVSFAVQYFSSGKIRAISDGVLGEELSNYDIAVNLSYGYPLSRIISVGANLKGIYSTLSGYNAMGFGADLGFYIKPKDSFGIGCSAHNLSSALSYNNTDEYLPFYISAGLYKTLNAASEGVEMTFSLASVYHDYGDWDIAIGLEHTAYKKFSLRGGYKYSPYDNRLNTLSNLSAGIGLNLSGLLIDYGWIPYGEMGYTHRIGMGYRFGADKKDKIRGVIMRAAPKRFSPDSGKLAIMATWLNITEKDKWAIEIIDENMNPVKTITGQGPFEKYTWDGKDDINMRITDGKYSIKMIIGTKKKITSNSVDITVDSTPPEFELHFSTKVISPNGDGKDDQLFMFPAGLYTSFMIKIFNPDGTLVKRILGEPATGEVIWDGTDDYYHKVVPNGDYVLIATAKDATGNTTTIPKTTIKVQSTPKTKRIRIEDDDRGLKIDLKSKIMFDTGHGRLKKSGYKSLDEVVSVIKAYPKNKVSVEGHTDSVGTDSANKALSLKRANAIKTYIVGKGVKASRMSVKGWGEEKPIASNRKRSGRAKNRRVEIIILKDTVGKQY